MNLIIYIGSWVGVLFSLVMVAIRNHQSDDSGLLSWLLIFVCFVVITIMLRKTLSVSIHHVKVTEDGRPVIDIKSREELYRALKQMHEQGVDGAVFMYQGRVVIVNISGARTHKFQKDNQDTLSNFMPEYIALLEISIQKNIQAEYHQPDRDGLSVMSFYEACHKELQRAHETVKDKTDHEIEEFIRAVHDLHGLEVNNVPLVIGLDENTRSVVRVNIDHIFFESSEGIPS